MGFRIINARDAKEEGGILRTHQMSRKELCWHRCEDELCEVNNGSGQRRCEMLKSPGLIAALRDDIIKKW